MASIVPGNNSGFVGYLPASEKTEVSGKAGPVSTTEGQQYVTHADIQPGSQAPEKLLARRCAKRYKQIPPGLLLKEQQAGGVEKQESGQSGTHFTRQLYQDTLKRADMINDKIQQLKPGHISKDALGAHKRWTPAQLKEYKNACSQATQDLKAELTTLLDKPEENGSAGTDKSSSVAKMALRVFWLQDQILSQTRPEKITGKLPEGIAKGLKSKQANKKDIMRLELTPRDKLNEFNTGMSGFSGLLTTTGLVLASLGDGVTKEGFKTQLVDSVNAKNYKTGVMLHGEYPQTTMKTELLRKITTKMNSLKRCLEGEDLQKLESLYRGDGAKIGGIDFIDHADCKVPDEFTYDREVINQLQQHLLKLQDFTTELGTKYGLDPKYS